MVSNQQIISDLRLIMEADHEVELLATYKGVPFICKAKIQEIEPDLVKLLANAPVLVCLKKDAFARVLGSDYFEPALAKVVSFDLGTGLVELNEFSYIGTKLGERMIVRVEPKLPIPVFIEYGKPHDRAYLIDLSINGIGLRIDHASYSQALKPGTTLQLNFQLPTGNVSITGIILSVTKRDDFYRLSIRFTQNGSQKLIIFKYLIDRRAEIGQELQQEYQTASQAA